MEALKLFTATVLAGLLATASAQLSLTNEQIADVLCRAAGHWGSGAEYLMQTVDQLERLGIHDANLWRLQRLVAQQLLAMQTPEKELK